ncbi:CPBP family intramembrane metalloprotease [Amycolatopsis acidicola]|uniref:CPBP family intramembrane metalloprotease n=1 Tax=Amycolatopsis acidicola TaxID=2596893 RepID=A0A5N0UMK0_9PSEU|nr:type II CAAX endopeptidase family protein [Amycolatopsis acidicola]KAA9151417.1 CPBP family intramembrane metalloprotease [Amycolatopsis acidicola]
MTTTQPDEPVPEPSLELSEPRAFPAHRWGFGAFLLVEAVLLASAAFVSVLLGPVPAGQPTPVRDVLIGTMAPTMLAALVAVLITVWRGNGPVLDLRLSWNWAEVRVGLKFGALGLVVTVLGAYVWTHAVGEDNSTSAIGALVENQPMSVTAAVIMFLYLWLLGPVCEEVIYRGLLWGAVERLHWGKEKYGRLAAFLLSTAVFAASHLEPLRTTLLIVIALPIGLARLYTGRLLGAVVAHQVNNFLPALAMLLPTLGVTTL